MQMLKFLLNLTSQSLSYLTSLTFRVYPFFWVWDGWENKASFLLARLIFSVYSVALTAFDSVARSRALIKPLN
jgi:hypothetical protein